MPLARDGIHRRSGETVLNLQPVPHHAREQFALRVCHVINLAFKPMAHKEQSPQSPTQSRPSSVNQEEEEALAEAKHFVAEALKPEDPD